MTITILLDIPESFVKQARYTVENIFFPYNKEFVVTNKIERCNNENNRIVYCMESSPYLHDPNLKKDLFIILENSSIEFFSHFKPYDLNDLSYIEKIPCIFPLKNKEILKTNRNIFTFDIIAASFFFLSCWQEYSISERNRKGRIPLNATLQNKLGIIRIPIVNEYLRIFEAYIKKLWDIKLEYKKLPGNTNHYIALSHDIDCIDWSLRKYINNIIDYRHNLEMDVQNLYNIVKNIWCKKGVFGKIKAIEMEYGVASTSMFFSQYPKKDVAFVHNLINELDGTAFEIGHHVLKDDVRMGLLYQKREQTKSLIKSLHGERVHTLQFEISNLFSQLEESNYYYDNSLLFPDDLGYRTGFTYPHYIFDQVRKKPFNVLAIPLNVMDGTLIERKYLCLKDNIVEKELFSFIEKYLQYGGVLSILFHHTFFWFNTRSRLEMYKNLLKYMVESGVNVGACRDIYLWHSKNKSNNRMQ